MNWTDCLTMEELNYNTDEVDRLAPSQINQIRMWLTNILFYGIEDLLDEQANRPAIMQRGGRTS